MKTVKSVLNQLTDPVILLQEVKETLRTLDPEYPEEKILFLQPAAALEQEVGPSAKAYLSALEQEIPSDIIFTGWQGFKLDLDCFTNPVNKLLLREDYEDLHLEHQMPALPVAQEARRTINIPFFSKVALRYARRRLETDGCKVQIKKVIGPIRLTDGLETSNSDKYLL